MQEKEFEEAKRIIAALKEQGASSVAAPGYCRGGKLSTAVFLYI